MRQLIDGYLAYHKFLPEPQNQPFVFFFSFSFFIQISTYNLSVNVCTSWSFVLICTPYEHLLELKFLKPKTIYFKR